MKNIIFFLFIFLSTLANADPDPRSIKALQELTELELRIETSLIKAALETGSYVDSPIEEMEQLFREKIEAEVITKNIDELVNVSPKVKTTLKSRLLRIVRNPRLGDIASSVQKKLANARRGASSFLKLKGRGVGILMVLANGIDVAIPPTLFAIGMPGLIPLVSGMSAVTPYPVLVLSAHGMINEKLRQSKLRKLLGKNFLSYKMNKARSLQILERDHKNYLNKIITNNGVEILATEKLNIKDRIRNVMNSNTNLNYTNAKRWARNNNVLDDFIHNLDNIELRNEYKLFRLVKEILNSEDIDRSLEVDFRLKFKSQFKENVHVRGFFEIKKWMKKMLEVKSLPEMLAVYQTAPKQLNPKLFATLWFNDFLPTYSKTLTDVDYRSFRKLVNNFITTKAILLQRPEDTLTKEVDDILEHYLSRSVNGYAFCEAQLTKIP